MVLQKRNDLAGSFNKIAFQIDRLSESQTCTEERK